MIFLTQILKRSAHVNCYIIVALALSVTSCSGKKKKEASAPSPTDIGIVTRAERFELIPSDSCTILKINNPWQGVTNVSQTYYLVKKGVRLKNVIDTLSVIEVPVKKVVCMSVTYIAMITALGEGQSIIGASGTQLIYNKLYAGKCSDGSITDVGFDSGLNYEFLINRSPDLVIMYGIGNESAGYVGKMKEMGIKILFDADYLEPDPLGKAEWIKLFGALYSKELLADSIFRSVESSYNEIKNLVSSKATTRPKVLLGLPYKDTWYISPGNSYTSRLISDAGGAYLWKDVESSAALPYGIESVYVKALEADYWLNPGTVLSKEEIKVYDPRLANLPCFVKGNIFNNNLRLNPCGGNDYWESGSVMPDIILKDMVSILHPDLLWENDLYFYRKIE